MKKLFVTAVFSLCFSILAGCGELPMEMIGQLLGDSDNDSVAADSQDNIQENNQALKENSESNDTTASKEDAEEEMETSPEIPPINECEDRNHARLRDSDFIMPDFYVPDCAILRIFDYSADTNQLTLVLVVEDGHREELYQAYLDYFGDRVSAHEEHAETGNIKITAHPFGDDVYPTKLYITVEDDVIVISVNQPFPE